MDAGATIIASAGAAGSGFLSLLLLCFSKLEIFRVRVSLIQLHLLASSTTGTITDEGRLDASRIRSPATKERARTATAPME